MSIKNYTPKEFGELIRRSVKTLQRWDREGIFKAKRTAGDRRYYTHDQYLEHMGLSSDKQKGKKIIYFRVSSANQKADLESQRKALEQFVIANGWEIDLWLSDIGSGLNYKRKNFSKILEMIEQGQVAKLIIAHKDRFVRFGFEWFENFAKNHGTDIIIMNQQSLSPEQEMVQDLLNIIHCFSSRLYGLRKYKKMLKEDLTKKDDSNNDKSN
jgi:predicted site-specific integrase-resolvase